MVSWHRRTDQGMLCHTSCGIWVPCSLAANASLSWVTCILAVRGSNGGVGVCPWGSWDGCQASVLMCHPHAVFWGLRGEPPPWKSTQPSRGVTALRASSPWEPLLWQLEALVASKEGGLYPVLLEEECCHINWAHQVGCGALQP